MASTVPRKRRNVSLCTRYKLLASVASFPRRVVGLIQILSSLRGAMQLGISPEVGLTTVLLGRRRRYWMVFVIPS